MRHTRPHIRGLAARPLRAAACSAEDLDVEIGDRGFERGVAVAGVNAEEVATARRKGLTFPQLVERFQCGVPALIYKLRRINFRIVVWSADAGEQRQRGARIKQVSVASILHLLVEGLTVPQVAVTLRCSESVVRNRLQAAGLILAHEEKRHGRRPDVTVEMVRSCHDEGLSRKAIARKLKCSYALVQSRLR